jgi:hypothetical protein
MAQGVHKHWDIARRQIRPEIAAHHASGTIRATTLSVSWTWVK